MAGLTTHVLDTAHGCPASDMGLRLLFEGGQVLVQTRTNADGRCDAPLITANNMKAGLYRLEFSVADYYRAKGVSLAEPAFLDVVAIEFGLADMDAHYHVPLLVSPYGYSTYRGS
jgi:5-hydroxyisourate hydrolase